MTISVKEWNRFCEVFIIREMTREDPIGYCEDVISTFNQHDIEIPKFVHRFVMSIYNKGGKRGKYNKQWQMFSRYVKHHLDELSPSALRIKDLHNTAFENRTKTNWIVRGFYRPDDRFTLRIEKQRWLKRSHNEVIEGWEWRTKTCCDLEYMKCNCDNSWPAMIEASQRAPPDVKSCPNCDTNVESSNDMKKLSREHLVCQACFLEYVFFIPN